MEKINFNRFRKYSYVLLLILALILVLSGIAKLITLAGTVEGMYKWLLFTPIGFFDRTYLRVIIQFVSILEIGFGIALFSLKQIRIYILYGIFLFLVVMLLVNGFQWKSGFESCGCFGQLIKISPGMTILKNLALILITAILIKYNRSTKVYQNQAILLNNSN